ncbi:hypothetical protein HBN50_04995 [Halobacteriovorax sp. GB3]|uniref:hypothetical protein n=1 Tax=Halobacteriovorax sp. GB3 TaxID=2719615 RepID=UPI0023625CCD|nr:hypothetical protein [Halobacteriovorax sp. GB3]MDD0852441.1 hypothetical protein [Halobacteriovorax sp. GB3]
MENNQNTQQCFIITRQGMFMYGSRAGLSLEDFLKKLQLSEEDFHQKSNGYVLTRKQYTAMLYKAGVLKIMSELTDEEQGVLGKVATTDLIQELERRTRRG